MTLKKIIHRMFHEPKTKSFAFANTTLAILTIVSVLVLILETVARFEPYHEVFLIIEIIAVGSFTLEYIGRIVISEKKSRYLFSFFGIIDLLAVLPSYLLLTNLTFLKSARLLHVIRILRILRIVKLVESERTTPHRSLGRHLFSLDIKVYCTILALAVTLLGSFLWATEPGNLGAENIPLAMLWVFQVILGGVSPYPALSVWGDVIIVTTRFTGLLLFGFLVYIVGHRVDRFLYGDIDPTRPSSQLARQGKRR
ncbi:MAG: ion transporter [Candidatus Paceibacterota bacterium]